MEPEFSKEELMESNVKLAGDALLYKDLLNKCIEGNRQIEKKHNKQLVAYLITVLSVCILFDNSIRQGFGLAVLMIFVLFAVSIMIERS